MKIAIVVLAVAGGLLAGCDRAVEVDPLAEASKLQSKVQALADSAHIQDVFSKDKARLDELEARVAELERRHEIGAAPHRSID